MKHRHTIKLFHVVGTRPNFMKTAAVMAAAERWNQDHSRAEGGHAKAAGSAPSGQPPSFSQILVHTGQHYDRNMSRVFFEELGLPRPDYDLAVGSGSHAEQTARVMLSLEPVLVEEAPDLVITVGDVNSTLAAAMVAAKLAFPVAHVEAGLRSRDRSMPEELNRILTDQLSDLLFTTSRDADANLATEGIALERIHFVGNTMIDSLEAHLPRALESKVMADMGLTPGQYAVVTFHRPSNVDDEKGLHRLVEVLREISAKLPVAFPVHARTRERLVRFGLGDRLGALLRDPQESRLGLSREHRPAEATPRITMCEPLGYLDFLGLMARARLVLTDSGGIQEETTALGIPCLTLRKNTERPVTISEGTNRLVDPEDVRSIITAVDEELAVPRHTRPIEARRPGPGWGTTRRPELWDGQAGDRIVRVIAETLGPSGPCHLGA
jgi:UDP-N-acetylglucosamine 2-epimerase (non-hydrolysing)